MAAFLLVNLLQPAPAVGRPAGPGRGRTGVGLRLNGAKLKRVFMSQTAAEARRPPKNKYFPPGGRAATTVASLS